MPDLLYASSSEGLLPTLQFLMPLSSLVLDVPSEGTSTASLEGLSLRLIDLTVRILP